MEQVILWAALIVGVFIVGVKIAERRKARRFSQKICKQIEEVLKEMK